MPVTLKEEAIVEEVELINPTLEVKSPVRSSVDTKVDEALAIKLDKEDKPPSTLSVEVELNPLKVGVVEPEIALLVRVSILLKVKADSLLLKVVQSAEAKHPAAEPVATVQSIAKAPPIAERLAVTVIPLVHDTVPVAIPP